MVENDFNDISEYTAQSTFNPGFQPYLTKTERRAKIFIWLVSIVVFAAVALLSRVKLSVNLGFDPHLFAAINAVINSTVTLLLFVGLWSVRRKKYLLHKRVMIAAIILSVVFLISYLCHHLFAGETKFGDADHNGIVTAAEKNAAGPLRYIYYSLLGTHIPLAGIILPFILFTAYRSLTGEYDRHKKLARITYPIWLYVAISGVLVYLMISPYYS
jgi:putative membrane protein